LKALMAQLGSPNLECRQDGAALDPAQGRASYVFNSGIAGIDETDAILLVGTNPRIEAPVINARIRERWRRGGLRVGLIGQKADLTYDHDYLGAGVESLAQLMEPSNAFHKVLKKAKQPMLLLGQGALTSGNGRAVLAMAAKLAMATGMVKGNWNGFNVLHTAAARVGALDLGFVPGPGGLDMAAILKAAGQGGLDVVYLLGADEFDMAALGNSFVIYQGTHGDAGAHRADVILPAAAYTEKSGTYVNTEGRVQMARQAVFPPGDAREDWTIIRALSGEIGKPLPFDSIHELRSLMYQDHPHLAELDSWEPADPGDIVELAKGAAAKGKKAFHMAVEDFYLTNPIARASAVMGQMSALKSGAAKATGTDG
ncbi:MAG: NADH-quinone oxidoreductase subunit G, partial [Alphaproteobacteria bacterium]